MHTDTAGLQRESDATSDIERGSHSIPANQAAVSLDEALRTWLSDFGRGQQRILLCASLSWASLAMVVLSMVFVSQDPVGAGQWRCVDPLNAQCAAAAAAKSSSGFCELERQQWEWTQPHNTLAATFGLVCSEAWKVGAANAVFFLGYWFGSFLFGWMSDNHGRRMCLVLSNVATAAAAAGAALSTNFGIYVAMRACAGFTCSGLPIAAYILATEAVGASWRGRAGILSQMIYHVGEWLLPLFAWALQDWRALNLAIAACCMITALLAISLPESPRWLLVSGRSSQAHQVLEWLAAANGREWPQGLRVEAAVGKQQAVQDGAINIENDTEQNEHTLQMCSLMQHAELSGQERQQAQGKQKLQPIGQQQDQQLNKQVPASDSMESSEKTEQARAWWLLLSHPRMRHYFAASSIIMLAMATSFYVLNLAVDNLEGSIYLLFFLTSLAEVPAAALGLWAVDVPRIGRRGTVLYGLLITSIGCICCGMLPPGRLQVALATLGKGACSGAWTVAYIYAAELFPVTIRSSAMGGTNQASRLGGVIAPAIMVFASSHAGSQGLPFVAIGLFALLAAVLVGPLPETRGVEPPDTVRGSDAAAQQGAYRTDGSPDAGRAGRDQVNIQGAASNMTRRMLPSFLSHWSRGTSGRWQRLSHENSYDDVECTTMTNQVRDAPNVRSNNEIGSEHL